MCKHMRCVSLGIVTESQKEMYALKTEEGTQSPDNVLLVLWKFLEPEGQVLLCLLFLLSRRRRWSEGTGRSLNCLPEILSLYCPQIIQRAECHFVGVLSSGLCFVG